MIQWYPGHMVKARKILEENIKKVDVLLEVLDARVPNSSRNPILQELIGDTQRIVVLNKVDLANPKVTKLWLRAFQNEGLKAIAVDSLSKKGIKQAISLISKTPLKGRLAQRFNLRRPVRAMVVGIPNVGKSMFINALLGKSSARTGDKPGVTRGAQWINVNDIFQLLDTPGILWPKFDDPTTGLHLAIVNSIGIKAYDEVDVAVKLIEVLLNEYPANLQARYMIPDSTVDPLEVIKKIGILRGFLHKENQVDYQKTCSAILKDFRDKQFGSISLEIPDLP
ncbi:MAG: ribosome biogenesis GTPase YlqF [Bacillota bacterium]